MTSDDRNCKEKEQVHFNQVRRDALTRPCIVNANLSRDERDIVKELLLHPATCVIPGLVKANPDEVRQACGMVPRRFTMAWRRLETIGFAIVSECRSFIFLPDAARQCFLQPRGPKALAACQNARLTARLTARLNAKPCPSNSAIEAYIADNWPVEAFQQNRVSRYPIPQIQEIQKDKRRERAAACGAEPWELKENLNVSLNATSTTTTSSPPAAEDRTGITLRVTEPVVVVENDLLRKWMAELTAKRPGNFTSCSQAAAAKLPQLRAELSHPVLQREIAAGTVNLGQLATDAAQITLVAVAQGKVRDRDAYYLGVVLCTLTQLRQACEKAPVVPATVFAGQGGGHGTYPPLRVVPGGSQRVGFRHPEDVRFEESARRFLNGGVA